MELPESKNNMPELEINAFSHWNSGDVLQNIVRFLHSLCL